MPKSPDVYPYLPGVEPIKPPQSEKRSAFDARESLKPAGEAQADGGLEVIHCQYCEDAGACMYCSRGKAEAGNLKIRRPA